MTWLFYAVFCNISSFQNFVFFTQIQVRLQKNKACYDHATNYENEALDQENGFVDTMKQIKSMWKSYDTWKIQKKPKIQNLALSSKFDLF